MATQYNATITRRVDLAPGTMALRIKLDGKGFAFSPGQYTVLGLHRSSSRIAETPPDSAELQKQPPDYLIRRAYSITSNSQEDELEFVITLVRSGDLTPRLFNLQVGGRIYVENKASGVFTLDLSSGIRDLLLVATGPALAPYLSMIRGAFPQSQEHQYVIVHAAAVSWDLAFRDQLEELSAHSKHLAYLPLITDPQRDKNWQGLTGTVEAALQSGEIEDLIGMPITPDRFDVFLSGSPQMITAVSAELTGRQFTLGPPSAADTNVFVERYW